MASDGSNPIPTPTETGVPPANAASSSNPPPVLPSVTYAKPFPDISRIEVFNGDNFKRWQERVFSVLDMHGVALALTDPKPSDETSKEFNLWIHANKVCRHTVISTLSNELFDVYCSYKEVRDIWSSMINKYTAEDVGKQKFVIGNFDRWRMTEDKDIKTQINEYHKLLEDLKSENIDLQEEFVAGILIERLPRSWSDYQQLLKHKHKQMSLADLITHIIIEDTNRKQLRADKGVKLTAKANLVQDKVKKGTSQIKIPILKRKETVLFVANLAIMLHSADNEN